MRATAMLAALAGATLVAACGGTDRETPATSAAAAPATAQASATCPRLSTRDGRIVDARGRTVLLRGVNVFAGENDKGVSGGELRRAARQGFNAVRLVAYWDTLEPRAPSGGSRRYSRAAFRALDAVIGRARRAGLYVILDPVHLFKLSPAFDGRGIPAWVYEGRGLTLEQAQDRLASDDEVHTHLDAFLRYLATRYRDNPTVVAIDPVNEPPSPDQDALGGWYDSMVQLLHEAAPSTMIFVEPQFGDFAADRFRFDAIRDRRNVVFSTHFYYAGGRGDGYGPEGSKAGRYVFEDTSGYGRGNEADLEAHLRVSLDAAALAGVPVHVSEFGIGRLQPRALAYVRDLTELFNRMGVGWTYWIHEARDKFSLTEGDGTYDELVAPLRKAAKRGGPAARTRCAPS